MKDTTRQEAIKALDILIDYSIQGRATFEMLRSECVKIRTDVVLHGSNEISAETIGRIGKIVYDFEQATKKLTEFEADMKPKTN